MSYYRRRESGLYVPEIRGFRGTGPMGKATTGSGPKVSTAVPNPVITSIDPPTGDTAGGATVTIWGSGFLAGDQVIVDNGSVTETVETSGKITFTTPAHAAGSVNVLVRRGGTDSNTVTFTFSAGGSAGPPSDAIVWTDWTTGTGTGSAARLDTGSSYPWASYAESGATDVCDVISAAGLGFPAAVTNVFRVYYVPGGASADVKKSGIADVEVGGALYYRVYLRWSAFLGQSWDHSVAGVRNCSGASWNWQYNDVGAPSGQWELRLQTTQFTPGYFRLNAWLDDDAVYRLEWAVIRNDTSDWTFNARIYNSSDVLLYDSDDFLGQPGGALLSAQTFNFSNTCLDQWNLGLAGLSPGEDCGGYVYYAAAALRTDDWNGAYTG